MIEGRTWINVPVHTIVLAISICACSSPGGPPNSINLNPYLKKIELSDPKRYSSFYMAVWTANTVFAIRPLSRFLLDENYNVLGDSVLEPLGQERNWSYIDANEDGSRLLLVESRFSDVSSGGLYEYDVADGTMQVIFDVSRNVSSARYLRNDETKLIYYSYGDANYNGAGFWLHDKVTQHDSLLYSYLSSSAKSEMLDGFDIYPNGDTLLIPISRSTTFDNRAPAMGVVSIRAQRLDTLGIAFDFHFNRTGLWLRLSKDASKVLYSCFPRGSYTETTNDGSEVGIIDLRSMNKAVLDVNTNAQPSFVSVQLAPTWSRAENAIIYGSAPVSIEGAAGRRSLYILYRLY